MRGFILAALSVLTCNVAFSQSDALVIVLDTSGSMGDYMRSAGKTRMEVAQDALITVLKDTPPTTKVGILTFGGWVYEIQDVDQQKIQAAIRSTRPGGGTPLYEYLRGGATKLLEERQNQNNTGYYKLLVVTDGKAGDERLNRPYVYGNGTTIPGVLTDIISRNLIVDVIALDMAEDHDLMRLNNGLDMRGDDEKSLTASLKKAVAEVGFGGQKDTDESAFTELDGIPDGFILSAIEGLTTFRNHPIGELPPIPVVQEDGTIQVVPNPSNQPIELGSESSIGVFFFICLGVIAVIMVLFFIKIGSR